ncbi:phosphoglycerate mutase-like protein [Whalleya microplaca]|nr:phosphoglycerate mutase-like protein [Whalleya microplaca]
MASRSLKAALGLLLASETLAQSTTETVWSSFAFVLHGERTPLQGKLDPSLTPLGAQQLYSQGQLFRARYLSNSSLSDEDNSLTTNSPITGIEQQALDNTQLSIFSTTDDFVTGSALAFIQGLYPPVTRSFAYSNGGVNASTLANGTQIEFPLDGYQYPNIQTLSATDPNSMGLEGQAGCTEYWISSGDATSEAAVQQLYNSTLDFYQSTWTEVFPNTLPKVMLSYDYAYDLWDYAQYAYDHSNASRDALGADRLATLRAYATSQQTNLNGNLSASGLRSGDQIRAVAGRTLAGKVVSQLSTNIASGGSTNKLTLMFGTFEPLLSFFALSELVDLPTTTVFQQLPDPGAAAAFELFSTDSAGGANASYPARDDLWVRFVYRNGTGADAPFTEYPLFGQGNSATRMRYSDFVDGINEFAIKDVASWCGVCDAVTLFCSALSSDTQGSSGGVSNGSNNSNAALSPAVAGVIGAVVTLAVLGLATTTAFVFGGVRLRRADAGHRASLGGFKGAEKMASDHDVSIVKNGARHERIGSWELGGPGPAAGTAPAAEGGASAFGASVGRKGDDDGDSIVGRAPVKPTEGV